MEINKIKYYFCLVRIWYPDSCIDSVEKYPVADRLCLYDITSSFGNRSIDQFSVMGLVHTGRNSRGSRINEDFEYLVLNLM